jgi:hypothetical protein
MLIYNIGSVSETGLFRTIHFRFRVETEIVFDLK